MTTILMNNKGLGKGLSSLIPAQNQKMNQSAHLLETQSRQRAMPPTTGLAEIPISAIIPNPFQPRTHFDPQHLQELADSIAQYGVLEPVVVTTTGEGQWQLVAGERRFRASQLAGKETIPAIIRTASDLERLEIALIENIQRADLNPIEQAHSLAKLINDFGLTQEQAAKKLGIARSSLANSIRLLELPVEIQQGLIERKITTGHAKVLLGLEDVHAQMELYKQMTSGRAMSVKELVEVAEVQKSAPKQRTQFVIGDFETKMLADKLQTALGTKVKIEKLAGEKRRISIDVFSSEELQGVIKKIVK